MKFADLKITARDDGLVAAEFLDKDGNQLANFTIEPDGAEKLAKGFAEKAATARKMARRKR